jgi:hypothetical protein
MKNTFQTMNRKLFSAFILAAISIPAASQAQPNLGKDEIDVIGLFNPTIKEARKIGKNPVINDTTSKIPVSKYTLIDKKVATNFEVEPIPSAKMKQESLTKLNRSYVKGGYGNYSTSLGEFYLNSQRSKEWNYTAYGRHLATTGSIPNTFYSGLSSNNLGFSASRFLENHTIGGGFDYDRNVVHYFGDPYLLNPFIDMGQDWEPERSFIRQRFNRYSGHVDLQSRYKDTTKLSHNARIGYSNLNALYDRNVEHHGSLTGRIAKYHNKELFGINAGMDYFHNTGEIDTSFALIVKINPEIIASGRKWRARAGLGIFMETETNETGLMHFYPEAEFSFNAIDNILTPYIGVTGGIERNSLHTLTALNPFVSGLSTLRNSDTRYNFFGGMKGSLSSNITFNTYASYKEVRNMAFFINDLERLFPDRFVVVYDDVKMLNLRGELAYQKSEKLKMLVKADWYRFEMTNELKPWHRPDFELTYTAFYNLRDKITIRGDIFYMNARYSALPYDVEGIVGGADIFPVKMKGFADVNLGVEYRTSKNLSFFVNFNNIGAVRYNRWYNYPTQRFNLLGGLTYSF